MNPSHSRVIDNFDREEVYEEYVDDEIVHNDYDIHQMHVSMRRPHREIKHEPLSPRRRNIQPFLSQRALYGLMKKPIEFKTEPTDGTILEEVGEEEVDVYEDMEEEDEEYETGVIHHGPPIIKTESRTSTNNGVTDIEAHRCIVCGRRYTDRYRLFKFPKEESTRKKWCDILHMDYESLIETLNTSNICAFHFGSRDFVCNTLDFRQTFWSSEARPRYRLRRPDTLEPFPWEARAHLPRISSSTRPIKQGTFSVRFRHSKYKIANTGKKRHPVAIVVSSLRPHEEFEFSYNRTSTIDGTKFYSCLHCRKAKSDTRDKDNIRTIHLDGTRLLSKGDPLLGHHHACTPNYVPIPRRDIGAFDEQMKHKINGFDFDGHNEVKNDERLVYVDDQSAFDTVNGAVVEVEGGDGMWTTQSHHNTHLGIDPSWVPRIEDVGMVDIDRGREEQINIRERIHLMNTVRSIKKRYRKHRRNNQSMISLGCPLCTRKCSSTVSLLEHIQSHLNTSPSCTVCGIRLDPALPLFIRNARRCSLCNRVSYMYNNGIVDR